MMKRRFIWSLFIIASMLFLTQSALAGSNALTRYDYDEELEVGYFDLVVSLDWAPTQDVITNRLQPAFYQFARDVYTMTEGRHELRNLYVFTGGQQMNTADIRLSDDVGRSSSYVNGIFQNGARILSYTKYEDGNDRDAEFIGHTLAHEFAHYAYGLYDEYNDETASSEAPPSQARPTDDSKETIMASQGTWQWFSTAADYVDKDQRDTAQWRIYQSSAWQTLGRNPNNDPTLVDWAAVYPRPYYDNLAGVGTELTMPSEQWDDSNFNVIYKQGNVAVLVIDHSGSMLVPAEDDDPIPMDMAKSAAQQFVDLMNFGDRVAVVGFSDGAAATIAVTELTNQAAKEEVKTAIDSLESVERARTNFEEALSQAIAVLQEGSSIEDTRYAVMLSDGRPTVGANTLDGLNLEPYVENEIPIYTIGLASSDLNDAGEALLNGIAETTGGTYRLSPTALDLADLYAEINRNILGTVVALSNQDDELDMDQTPTNEMTTWVSDQDTVVTFRANWDPDDNMAFSLIAPDGTVIDAGSLPQGASYVAGSGYGLYTIRNPLAGEWTSVLTATAINASGQIAQEASAQSTLNVQLDVSGGDFPEPIAIMAAVNGPEPVTGANVVAQVTLADDPDEQILEELTLRDDGETPDLIADDGVYSGVYASYTQDGDYIITVNVDNGAGTATLDTSGALEKGTDAPPVQLSDFRRHIEGAISVSGYTELPSDSSDAQETRLNNQKNWGMIQQANTSVYYQFEATADQTYFISTSNLLSWDESAPLSTVLTIYDTDGVTALDTSSNYSDSGLSRLQWTAPASGTYYVSVGSNGGAGNFALTIGTVDIVTPTITQAAEDDSNDGSDDSGDDDSDDDEDSSEGCFINTLATGDLW